MHVRRLLVLVVFVVALAGCATPEGARVAIEAAQRANEASREIIAIYDAGLMETFDQVRASFVREAKAIVDRQAAAGEIDADFVKTGFDRLLANLDEAQANRDEWIELMRVAMENCDNADEALFMADDLLMRAATSADEMADMLTNLKARLMTRSE